MSWEGEKGEPGMPGPSGITNFEMNKWWSNEHVKLQNLCFDIVAFLSEHPDLASKVEITKDSIKSFL